MSVRPASRRVVNAAAAFGSHLRTWRKLLRLSAEVTADRAGISRGTLRRLENGDPSVKLETVFRVAAALGILETVAESADPLNSDFGRLRAFAQLPKRVRTQHG
ncbi:MAG: helix-turn-helix domain-containing protein [Propionibacteriaceae bacterium]|jgi:transcriptional regulator with XRE-family HTH domain|nr:helix-turn-helix domain-containing protein [Propionibacteriaceae bacterium]